MMLLKGGAADDCRHRHGRSGDSVRVLVAVSTWSNFISLPSTFLLPACLLFSFAPCRNLNRIERGVRSDLLLIYLDLNVFQFRHLETQEPFARVNDIV